MRIVVDGMGGDNAPKAVVGGVVEAIKEYDVEIVVTGDKDLFTSKNLVVYSNIFQDNKLFVREYEDISKELDEEKKNLYKQNIKVEPLNNEEIRVINDDNFIFEKIQLVLKKYQ